MDFSQLRPDVVVRGNLFPEPVHVLAVTSMGDSVKLIGKGTKSNQVYEPILSAAQLSLLEVSPEREPFDGNADHFRIGVEALRLGIAYEYDPFFSLSIARVDPLPHQLEAVYDYFLRMPRIRFLLADDPGAGKTIMAGLLIKELKIRGLVKRTLIVTPANLTFQWQREMKERFHEQFEVIRGDVLRANYGSNPWQERNQLITSVSWVSRMDDARESLLRSHWDLVIVDEAHKMSAYSEDHKTLAYRLGEALSDLTDHYLLMTATPHKGDPKNFCLFLGLLDKDVYGDVASLEEAMRCNEAPFYLRRVKEALVSFPDEHGVVKTLFTRRNVHTLEFALNNEELDLYDALTHYVDDQSIKASIDDSARGRALGFTMAMLQRRFASSVYAVRRSLERMKEKREKILADPDAYRQEQIAKKLPEDFDDLPDDEQQEILAQLEEIVASLNPDDLRDEIATLARLIREACNLERKETESKLAKLKETMTRDGVFRDPKMKLLLFTEHKDTLDYLVTKLRGWGLTVTQIHGSMKIGDRNTPGTRICAEREFREECQVLVATEAAGEGINLQFCWYLINYDIPWNPVRLEQRMGRIHRYGQEKDCLIQNFVSTNTREGRVLNKLFERIAKIEEDLDPRRTGKVFNVLGDVFPANALEKMLRDMYAQNLTEDVIKKRIVEQVDTQRFKRITENTLEGLAKRQLNLSALVGRSAEAKERRLVPEAVEDFFCHAAPLAGITPRQVRAATGRVYRIGRVPRTLWPVGEQLEPRFGPLGRDYKEIVFDKELLKRDATWEWVTPGHPLFEAVRADVLEHVQSDLEHGAVFYDLQTSTPYCLDVYSASISDGRGNVINRRLFVVQTHANGSMDIRQPTIFLDIQPAPAGTTSALPDAASLPGDNAVQTFLHEQCLAGFRDEVVRERERELETVERHMEISLNSLIGRLNVQYAEMHEKMSGGIKEQGIEGRYKMIEDRLYELNGRLERRREELKRERQILAGEVSRTGRAWVVPHPERDAPAVAPMVRSDEIERIAVDAVIAFEEAQGRTVLSVENENRGFDLISRKPHPEDPATAIDVRFIEVKGRAGVGDIALSANEFKTAERLKDDYWLYVVYHCATQPQVHALRNPMRIDWKSVVRVEHYIAGASAILATEEQPS